jgi:hypothetical protein
MAWLVFSKVAMGRVPLIKAIGEFLPPVINQMKGVVWVPGLPFLCHNKLVCLHRLLYRESLSHTPSNDISSQVDSLLFTSD